jgi:hypothetical protein
MKLDGAGLKSGSRVRSPIYWILGTLGLDCTEVRIGIRPWLKEHESVERSSLGLSLR